MLWISLIYDKAERKYLFHLVTRLSQFSFHFRHQWMRRFSFTLSGQSTLCQPPWWLLLHVPSRIPTQSPHRHLSRLLILIFVSCLFVSSFFLLHPPIYPPYNAFTHPSIHASMASIHPSIQLSIHPSSLPFFRLSVGPSVHTYIYHSFFLEYLPTYLATCLPFYLFTCRHQPNNLPVYLPTYLLACPPTYLPTCLPFYPFTCLHLPNYLNVYLPTYLPTYLPPCLPTYLLSYLPTYLPTFHPSIHPSIHPSFLPSFLPSLSWSFFTFLVQFLLLLISRLNPFSLSTKVGWSYKAKCSHTYWNCVAASLSC